MNKSRVIGTIVVILLLAGAAFWLARDQKEPVTPPVGQNQNATATPKNILDVSNRYDSKIVSTPTVFQDSDGKFEFTAGGNDQPFSASGSTSGDGSGRVILTSESGYGKFWRIPMFSTKLETWYPVVEALLTCDLTTGEKERIGSVKGLQEFKTRDESGWFSPDKKTWYLISKSKKDICKITLTLEPGAMVDWGSKSVTQEQAKQEAWVDSEPYLYYFLNTFKFLGR